MDGKKQKANTSSGRVLWSDEETAALLQVWSGDCILRRLAETQRNAEVFLQVSDEMKTRGFVRTAQQCTRKVKKLRQKYVSTRDEVRRSAGESAADVRDTCPFYEELDIILNGSACAESADPKGGGSDEGVAHLTPPPGRLHTCSLCPFSHSEEDGLLKHIRQKHTGGEPGTEHDQQCYSCSICGKMFLKHSSSRRHMLMHKGEKNYLCTECGKAFLTSGELLLHTRTHTGERPYKCKLCGKGFIARRYLVVHTRIHTGEKPFACTLCPRAFNASKYLKRHMSIHNDKRPFKCVKCGKGFVESYHWKMHMRTSKCTIIPL